MQELVIFDIDGTLIAGQSQEALINFLYKRGSISWFSYISLGFWFLLYKLGIVRQPETALRFALKFLRGWKVSELEETINTFFAEDLKKRFYQQSLKIIREHLKKGREVILVSNAIEPLVKQVADELGIKDFICTKLETKEGKYTGEIEKKMVYGENKVGLIEAFKKNHGLSKAVSWGYGDHLSDVPFLSRSTYPCVVNPSGELLNIARAKHWQIINTNG